MFRNPRENSKQDLRKKFPPSIGRAPTPPKESARTPVHTASPYSGLPNPTSSTDTSPSLRRPSATKVMPLKNGNAKINGKRQNQSILNFFGKQLDKVSSPETSARDSDSLFFEEKAHIQRPRTVNAPALDEASSEWTRYNELETPIKRRKTDAEDEDAVVRTPSPEIRPRPSGPSTDSQVQKGFQRAAHREYVRHRGGFVDDSSSDEEDVASIPHTPVLSRSNSFTGASEEARSLARQQSAESHNSRGSKLDDNVKGGADLVNGYCDDVAVAEAPLNRKGEGDMPDDARPSLSREATSVFDLDSFNEMGEFEGDEFFEGGEEMMERRWMEEQRMLEIGLDDDDSKSESNEEDIMTPNDDMGAPSVAGHMDDAACPMCSVSLAGATEQQASVHVNACLDGNPTPLPIRQDHAPKEATKVPTTTGSPMKRFQRAAIARPGQQNPYSLLHDETSRASAFSRLMSGNAEDAAWAEAASNEVQSRGKPAYQRTCPFYKIMPGMYICVDAFRYGKVEGQNAYFLSHFHSDHYIGLTSSWCHGPIYCSKVTANLVRQQLRVDPNLVVPLDFEKKVEIPNTHGVSVTMLPANHCPGSSLFLFEKVVSPTSKGAPRVNRILHCGDFRACPAHVNHPLLKPDIVDAVTGQTRQQVIDTCYLDTTYLTPKYAFPPQSDVIDACAQMCVSLSKEIVDSNDSWEKVKLERAGSTMTRFLEKPHSEDTLAKADDDDDDKKSTTRGRLLVVIGTYSIGKERICLGIAKALKSKIYAPPAKMRVCKCLEDDELDALLTSNPLEAQVHMQTLMEIRAETLHDYLVAYKGHFSRVVGFRPTGWNYRPPTSRFTENPAVSTVLASEGWKSTFTMKDLVPGRGSTRESHCFGVPYSEHSSFRELTMFCCALRIGRVIPTVNVGSAKSREKMKGWIEKWELEKKKNGLFKVETGADGWGSGDGALSYGV
jgi:DNA cross-link repair 1A protein